MMSLLEAIHIVEELREEFCDSGDLYYEALTKLVDYVLIMEKIEDTDE